jgi:DNA-binding transcriptional regulator YdaS (Cro superfamily)
MGKRTELQKWCDKQGHGARAVLARETGLRYQTVHDLFKGTRTATVATARKIEKATKGSVPWTSLVG